MAQPIAFQPPPRDARHELRQRLDEAPIEHAEALLDSYELLQQLRDSGIFKILNGALSARNKLIETAVDAAKSEESVRALRNAIILAKILGSINPEILQAIAVAVDETLGSPKKSVTKAPGLFSILGQFRHKGMHRSMSLINRFLESLGKQLAHKSR